METQAHYTYLKFVLYVYIYFHSICVSVKLCQTFLKVLISCFTYYAFKSHISIKFGVQSTYYFKNKDSFHVASVFLNEVLRQDL